MPIYKTRLYLTNPIHCNHPERNPGKANYHCQLFEGTDNKTSCDDFAIMCIFSSNKPGSCFQVGDFHRQGLPSCDFHLLITRSISPRLIVSLQYLNHEITHMQSDRVQLINKIATSKASSTVYIQKFLNMKQHTDKKCQEYFVAFR